LGDECVGGNPVGGVVGSEVEVGYDIYILRGEGKEWRSGEIKGRGGLGVGCSGIILCIRAGRLA